MRRRVQLQLIVALTVIAGVAAFLWLRQPSYGGRGLRAWLRDFESGEVDKRAAAADAVRHIGSGAVPILVEQLRSPRRATSKASRLEGWKQALAEYLKKHTSINIGDPRSVHPRFQAFAALDALGPVGKDALPALEKLLHESPPDPDALYIVARIGEAGDPILQQALTNEERLIRLESAICRKMRERGNAVSNGSDLRRRLSKFHLDSIKASVEEHMRLHPELSATNPVPAFMPPVRMEESNAFGNPLE